MWFRKRKVQRRKRKTAPNAHYVVHKEFARKIIHERIEYWNQHYNFSYNRISIRNQKTCWGSCSEKGNLNFNYKIIFLPESLMDYVIVHELCHLEELNHSNVFWNHVGMTLPDYKERKKHLRRMTHIPASGFPSSVYVLKKA